MQALRERIVTVVRDQGPIELKDVLHALLPHGYAEDEIRSMIVFLIDCGIIDADENVYLTLRQP